VVVGGGEEREEEEEWRGRYHTLKIIATKSRCLPSSYQPAPSMSRK